MKDLDKIYANSDHHTITRISKDRVKKINKPDCSKMFSISVPALRATFYKKTLALANKKAKELKKARPGIEIIIKNPEK
jgi:hypothetical protein